MKRNRSNYNQRMKCADTIRKIQNGNMVSHAPTDNAKKWMKEKPYQVHNLIRAQAEQMEHEDVLGYLARKGVDTGGQD